MNTDSLFLYKDIELYQRWFWGTKGVNMTPFKYYCDRYKSTLDIGT